MKSVAQIISQSTITHIFDDGHVKLPTPVACQERRTFDVGGWLVLDDYGNCDMPISMQERVMGLVPGAPWTLAVERSTGQLAKVTVVGILGDDDDDYEVDTIAFDRLNYWMLKDYLPRLDDLRLAKRPFTLLAAPEGLMLFIDREIGYRELAEEYLVFSFDFCHGRGHYVEVMRGGCRGCTVMFDPNDDVLHNHDDAEDEDPLPGWGPREEE